MDDDRQQRRPKRPQHRNEYTAFDRALIRAKEENKIVNFEMAEGTLFSGRICSVDKYFIEIEESTNNIWLAKAMIVSAVIG